ncbi:hypothetical protein [Methylobacter luteus]|uniref:hypothetical protein n=1 Tax=Methylobacter luteus TaxID=415 RepID=UPI00041621BE|nr:hypothetical protein [Methylobacter luteus]
MVQRLSAPNAGHWLLDVLAGKRVMGVGRDKLFALFVAVDASQALQWKDTVSQSAVTINCQG